VESKYDVRVKFNRSITLLARLDHDKYGDPHTSEEWTFEAGEEIDVSSIDWSAPMKVRHGKNRTGEARFAKLNIEEQRGYVWMVPEDVFVIL
jgi:hypothetical protein